MYDAIIIGLGSMGSSTLYQLAKRGVKVLGLEQFEIAHKKGSHSGQTRTVRKAYFEHPDYVPLLEGAYSGWDSIYQETGRKLFYKTGLAYFGERDHSVMASVRASAKLYDIELNSGRDTSLGMFNVPSNYETIVEPEAGFALTDETIQSYVNQSIKFGANVKLGVEVKNWKLCEDFVEVFTDGEKYKTQKLIITAGAYVKPLLPQLANQLEVTRQLLVWVKPKRSESFELGNFPSWVIADKEYSGVMYGFPILQKEVFGGDGLLKLAHHNPAEVIDPDKLNEFNPSEETAKIKTILKKYLPNALGDIVSASACMYTNTKDEHFITDFLPATNQRIIIGSGFSGHGFKFVPVVGEVLADLALEGKTKWPIEFLGIDRVL